MKVLSTDPAIEGWLHGVRGHVERDAPDLLARLDPYIGEARFGRAYIHSDLVGLKPHACVLEIGAGSLLLSCQLVREGFDVIALEPVAQGFSHFSRLQELVIEFAQTQGCVPRVLKIPAEELDLDSCVDYAFSINVMEHIGDVACVVQNIAHTLKTDAKYRFTCPNYLFPYEPHFNILTLFSKSLTARWFADRIFDRLDIDDPEGTWRSLNWITVPKVSAIVRKLPLLEVRFGLQLLVSTIERMVTDPEFSARRSGWLRACLKALVRLRLHKALCAVPAALQPIMDCVLTKKAMPEATR